MTVEEIQALVPEAKVYRLDPAAKYLIIADVDYVSAAMEEGFVEFFSRLEIPFAFISTKQSERAIRILELKP